MKNVFIPDHQKEMILDLYTEVTLKYSRIRRCFFKYWFSKQKTCNSVDLSYTPFTEYKSSQYFHILDGRKKYLFTHILIYTSKITRKFAKI